VLVVVCGICIIALRGCSVCGCSLTCLCAQPMDVPSRELSNLFVCTPDPCPYADGPAVRLVSSESRGWLAMSWTLGTARGRSDVAAGLARVYDEHEVMLLLAVHAQLLGRHVKQTSSNGSNSRLKNAF